MRFGSLLTPKIRENRAKLRTSLAALLTAFGNFAGTINADGEEALRDKRKTNGGRPFLDAPQQASLEKALSAPPVDGGLWTGPKVATWISGTLKRPVSAVTGWKYLRRLGWTLQRPRPEHQASATPEAQQTFKKN